MDHYKAVEDYFKSDRTLRGGRELYHKLPGKSLAIQNAIARFPESKANVDKVHYELAKAVGMPERMRIILTQKPLAKAKSSEATDADVEALTPEAALLSFNPDETKYQDAKKLVKALDLKVEDQKKVTIFKVLSAAREAAVKKK